MDFPFGRAAVILDRDILTLALTVEAALGQRIERLLGGLVVSGGDRHGFPLLVTLPLSALNAFENSCDGFHAVAATQMNPRQLNLGFRTNHPGSTEETTKTEHHGPSK